MGTQNLSDGGALSTISLLPLLEDEIPTDSSPGSSVAARDLAQTKEGTSPWPVYHCASTIRSNLGSETEEKAPLCGGLLTSRENGKYQSSELTSNHRADPYRLPQHGHLGRCCPSRPQTFTRRGLPGLRGQTRTLPAVPPALTARRGPEHGAPGGGAVITGRQRGPVGQGQALPGARDVTVRGLLLAAAARHDGEPGAGEPGAAPGAAPPPPLPPRATPVPPPERTGEGPGVGGVCRE